MDKATLHLEVTYPSRYFSDEARSLIQGLLIRDPLLRLGANGAAEVKAHPFFAHVDWGMLDTGQVMLAMQWAFVAMRCPAACTCQRGIITNTS